MKSLSIFNAIEAGDIPRVRNELQALKQADPKFSIDDFRLNNHSPVQWAIRHQMFDVAIDLLEGGSNARQRGDEFIGTTLLCQVLNAGGRDQALALVQRLLELGVDTGVRTKTKSLTHLHIAALTNRPAILRSLIESGMSTEDVDVNGESALSMAAHRGFSKIIQLLLDSGADHKGKDLKGQTALHRACASSCANSAIMLLERGADVHARTIDGKRAIEVCEITEIFANTCDAEKDEANLTRLALIAYGADTGHMTDNARSEMRRSKRKIPPAPSMRQAAILGGMGERLRHLLKNDSGSPDKGDTLPRLIRFCALRNLGEMGAIVQSEMAQQAIEKAMSGARPAASRRRVA